MKTLRYLSVIFVATTLLSMGNVKAQPGEGNRNEGEHKAFFNKNHSEKGNDFMIPNLTDEQKAKIKDLRLANFKEVQKLRNQLGELKAKERTLTTAEKPDTKIIEANIDDISKIQGQIMKSRTLFKLQVRSLLTDEQRIFFDMHRMKNREHGKASQECPMKKE